MVLYRTQTLAEGQCLQVPEQSDFRKVVAVTLFTRVTSEKLLLGTLAVTLRSREQCD